MYNGCGLPTVRGTGTSGFVQRSLAYLRADVIQRRREAQKHEVVKELNMRKPKDIVVRLERQEDVALEDHARKRAVNQRLTQFLEAEGYLDRFEDLGDLLSGVEREKDSAELRKAKEVVREQRKKIEKEMETSYMPQKKGEVERLRNALDIESSYVAGSAFDSDLMEKEKMKRKLERQRVEREKILKEIEREEIARYKKELREERERKRRLADAEEGEVLSDLEPKKRRRRRRYDSSSESSSDSD